jgi:hypothetical protein
MMTTHRDVASEPGGNRRRASKPPLPDPPKKPDMQQFNHYHRAAIGNTLYRHFSHRADVLVSGEGYLCFERSQIRSGWLEPDLVVAFSVDPDAIEDNNGYEIDDVGKSPEFVLEVASQHTGRRDYTAKRDGYAGFGVGEYWRFDYTGRQYHDGPLAGDFLVDGRYEPAPLVDDRLGKMYGMLSGYSAALDLFLCWDDGKLRFYDSNTDDFLLDPSELQAALVAAEDQRDAARADRDAIQAERDAANERIRQLEARLRDNKQGV